MNVQSGAHPGRNRRRCQVGLGVQTFRPVVVALVVALFTVHLVLTAPPPAGASAALVADISVSQTASATSLVPGLDSLLTLEIVVENAGPIADPVVLLSNELPEALTCSWTSVATGGASGHAEIGSGDLVETVSMPADSSVSYTMNCTFDAGAAGTVSNTVSAMSSVTDPDLDNNSATVDVVMAPSADIRVVLGVGPYLVVPGRDTVDVEVWVHNLGPSTDPQVSIVDALLVSQPSLPIDELLPVEASCTFTSEADDGISGNTPAGSGRLAEIVSMPPRTTATYKVSCSPDPEAPASWATYVATASASVTELYPGDNQSSDNDFQIDPQHDVSITVDDGRTAATPGLDTIVYTITVANAGPSAVPAAEVMDEFPSMLTCSWSATTGGGASGNLAGTGDIDEVVSLPSGSSVTYAAACAAALDAGGFLNNTATVHTGGGELVLSNNTDSDTDTQLTPVIELPETGRPLAGLSVLGLLMLLGGGALVIAAKHPRRCTDNTG